MVDFTPTRQDYLTGVGRLEDYSCDANVKNVGKKIMWICRTLASPNHNKARQNISFYLHNINNCRAHESQMNCYSNNNKTKLNKTICISYGMHCVCSNGSIRSQRSLLLTWSPFDASPITKLFMILVSRARRPATIPWAIIPEPYHLATSLQVVCNYDTRGWTDMFALGHYYYKRSAKPSLWFGHG